MVGNPTVPAHDFLLFLTNSNVVCFNRLSGGPLDILDHETTVGLTDRLYRLTVLRQIGITTVIVSVFKRLSIATIVNEQNT